MLQELDSYTQRPKEGVSNRYTNEFEDDLVAPLLWAVIGVRNSGKSFLVSQYVIHSQKRKIPLYDRIFMITPSYASNRSYWEPHIDEADVIEPDEEDAVGMIVNEVEREGEEWDDFVRQKRAFEDLKGKLRTNAQMTDEELITSLRLGLLDPSKWLEASGPKGPEWKREIERPAQALLILDDCLGSPKMMQSAQLSRIATLNRHIAPLEEAFVDKGGNVRTAVGLSVVFLSQTYKSKTGGPARLMRENLTHATIYETKQPKMLGAIVEELGSSVDESRFLKAYSTAIKEPYGSVTLDFKPPRPELQFRLGLSKAIVV